MEFENLPRFKDKTFKPSKLSPTIGYKRDGTTTEMLNEPQLLYRYVYGSSSSGMLIYIFNVHVPVRRRAMPILSQKYTIQHMIEIIRYTNERINSHNANVTNQKKVKLVTQHELELTISILIIGKIECGAMPFEEWFKTRLNSNINMFQSIDGISSCDVKFPSYSRFMKILRFLASGPIRYINRKTWKKSSAVNHRETGGYFIDGNTRTLDLHVLFRPFIELFNTNSKSVYKCSGRVCLDEVVSKSRSNHSSMSEVWFGLL